MPLLSWLRKRTTGRPQTRRTPAGSPTPRFRPRLETLERRDVPSTLTVTNNHDGGGGSLRAEIAAAQSGDTIVFDPRVDGKVITLTKGVLDLNKNLTIQGPGAGQLMVNGDHKSVVFQVEAQVALSGLTIAGGGTIATQGGGIENSGTLTVSDCNITQNVASDITSNVPSGGGGIYNSGTLTLNDCTLSANTAGYGGGIYNSGGTLTASGCTLYDNQAGFNGGGVYTSHGTANLTNCTLSNNVAFGSTADSSIGGGGGIFVALRSTANLTNCTLSLNAAKYGDGGGIYVWRGLFGGILNLTNTIVAGNTTFFREPDGPDIYGAVATADHSLVGDAAGSTGIVNGSSGNLVGGNGNPVINADLGPLQNNGGPTLTMALLAGSPAIGQADNSQAPATDQRGVTRLDVAGETTDIGAFEV
jgi:hypothetical protein